MDDRRSGGRQRRKIKVSHILLALLVLAIAAFAVFRIRTKFRLRARIDAVRRAGYPVTCEELDAWYSITPGADNAAYAIDQALSRRIEWDKDKSSLLPVVGGAELPARTEPLPAEMKALIAEYVADNKEAIELLSASAAIRKCRYPVDFRAGLATAMPNLSGIKGAAQLLKLEAILHAENGDGASATRSVVSCFAIGRSLAGLPMTIGQLIRASTQAIAVTAIERLVNRTDLTDEQLAQLIECVRDSESSTDISCAFVAERCMGLSFFKDPQGLDPAFFGGGGGVPFGPLLLLYRAAGMVDSDAVVYLDLMEGYVKAACLPPQERQEATAAVEARLRSTSKAHILVHAIMPGLARVTTLDVRTIAHLRTAQAGLAVQRYRLTASRLPDKLSELVPAYLETIPRDPFDGNDLRYRRLERGFVVYSIGEDLSDDGGKELDRRRSKGQKTPRWDVTFLVER